MYLFVLVMLGLHRCAQSFSSCGEWRLLFCNSCRTWASHCGAFSCCGPQVMGLPASEVVMHGFSCGAIPGQGLLLTAERQIEGVWGRRSWWEMLVEESQAAMETRQYCWVMHRGWRHHHSLDRNDTKWGKRVKMEGDGTEMKKKL